MHGGAKNMKSSISGDLIYSEVHTIFEKRQLSDVGARE
jgi:hypothetical protein